MPGFSGGDGGGDIKSTTYKQTNSTCFTKMSQRVALGVAVARLASDYCVSLLIHAVQTILL